ncbi:MAG: hypothetical protein CMJ85_07000 [Planctomycetes bacterium]|nr:hypothetical protein [Planctomycetota bacterium]
MIRSRCWRGATPLTFLLAAGVSAPAQDTEKSPLERFQALDPAEQSAIVRGISKRLMLDPDPVMQRILSLQRGFKSYPLAKPATYHKAAKWAKGVAPKRTLVKVGEERHAVVRSAIRAVPFVPELNVAIRYDWTSGEIQRRAEPLSDLEVFENLLNGFAPGSDETLARMLEILDKRRSHAKVAAWAAHLYADLDARVYDNITIYEAWYAGKIMDIPDVDAVPFAIKIIGTRSYRSPIPAGRRRTRLYQKIRNQVFEYRKYRTLREAAAAAFVSPDPELDAPYQPLIQRFHWLYQEHDEDPLAVASYLAGLDDRDEFLRWTDKNVRQSRKEYDKQKRRRDALIGLQQKVRRMALRAVAE